MNTPFRQLLSPLPTTAARTASSHRTTGVSAENSIHRTAHRAYTDHASTSTPNLLSLDTLKKNKDPLQWVHPNLVSRRRSKGALITAVSRAPSSVNSREPTVGVVKPQNSSHKGTQSLTETAPRLRVSRKRLLTESSGE